MVPENDRNTNTPNIRASSQAAYQHGLQVVPNRRGRKHPALDEYSHYYQQRMTPADLEAMPWSQADYIGVLSGDVSGGVICLDVDCKPLWDGKKPEKRLHALKRRALTLLGLPIDYRWAYLSGSGKGFHIWIQIDNPTTKQVYSLNIHEACHLEIRGNACYTVFYPATVPDTPPAKLSGAVLARLRDTLTSGLKTDTPKEHKPAPRRAAGNTNGLHPEIVRAIEVNCLYPLGLQDNGKRWSKPFLCFCRHHKGGADGATKGNPSMGYDFQRNVARCMSTGTVHTLKEIAIAIKGESYWQGLLKQYVFTGDNRPPDTSYKSGNTKRHDPRWFSGGVPWSVIEALLALNLPPSEMFNLPPDAPALERWIDDPANGLAVWMVAHTGVNQGLIDPDGILTSGILKAVGKAVGHELTDKTIRQGLDWLVTYGIWEVIENHDDFAYIVEQDNYSMQKSHEIPRAHGNATWYRPRPLLKTILALYNLILYELPTSYEDYLPVGWALALQQYRVTDTLPVSRLEKVGSDGSTYIVEESLTDRLMCKLDALRCPDLLLTSPAFVVPDGFSLTNAKALRVAFLKAYYDHHKDTDGYLELSIADKAQLLGISSRSVHAYSAAAGLATEQQTSTTTITDKDPDKRAAQFNKVVGKRSRGVFVQLGDTPTYVTEKNRPRVLEAVKHSPRPVTITIQRKSKLYEASEAEIEEKAQERAAQHAARLEKRQQERVQLGLPDPSPPTRQRATDDTPDPPPPVIQPRSEGYTEAYRKTMVTLLVYLNPELHDIAQRDGLIADLLDRYGLLKVRNLQTDNALIRAG